MQPQIHMLKKAYHKCFILGQSEWPKSIILNHGAAAGSCICLALWVALRMWLLLFHLHLMLGTTRKLPNWAQPGVCIRNDLTPIHTCGASVSGWLEHWAVRTMQASPRELGHLWVQSSRHRCWAQSQQPRGGTVPGLSTDFCSGSETTWSIMVTLHHVGSPHKCSLSELFQTHRFTGSYSDCSLVVVVVISWLTAILRLDLNSRGT